MASFVLVHGGGHGAWCWQRLTPLLTSEGHDVHTPVLTGVGERFSEVSAATGLSTHIEDVVRLLQARDLADVILCGHSYGGIVITGVAGSIPERIRELVFLDAPQPQGGENLCDASPGALPVFEKFKRKINGIELTLFPEPDVLAAFGLSEPEDVAWALRHLTPHPMQCFLEPLDPGIDAAVDAIPRSSIDCVATRARRSSGMLHRPRLADRRFEIDTGHDLMITCPREVADILLEIAANPAEKREANK